VTPQPGRFLDARSSLAGQASLLRLTIEIYYLLPNANRTATARKPDPPCCSLKLVSSDTGGL
jgi:hypothetical protein